jgi:antitoxin (DNA-binding transcriptional repressor) of toxin-antitoxin stability system
VVIARAGKPIADLVPHVRPDVVFGTARGAIDMADDFDEPLTDLIEAFDGR